MMNQQEIKQKMRKYYIGLAIIGAFTVVVLVITLVQGASTKQDRVTYKKATEIATELNTYISSNEKIPASFSEAGITDVPSTISYKKDSETEYTFCATYKQARNGESTPDLFSGSAVRSGVSLDEDLDYSSSYKSSTLYPTYSYKKGENCQTIKPYLYSSSSYQQPISTPRNTNPVTSYSDAQAKARDTQRIADINSIYAKLEEYYNDNNSYPSEITASLLPGIDSEALIDPNKKNIVSAKSATSESAALAVKGATSTENYLYVPFGCVGSACKGYILKTYIEVPTSSSTNPYTKKGLNNI